VLVLYMKSGSVGEVCLSVLTIEKIPEKYDYG
jgi:hypothetical protein